MGGGGYHMQIILSVYPSSCMGFMHMYRHLMKKTMINIFKSHQTSFFNKVFLMFGNKILIQSLDAAAQASLLTTFNSV